jgi:hypothetical protein
MLPVDQRLLPFNDANYFQYNPDRDPKLDASLEKAPLIVIIRV